MLTNIPERARQVFYTAYALIVIIEGGLSVGFNSAGNGQPTWLDVALDVTAYAGVALGITAAANVGNAGPPPLAVEGRHEAPGEAGQMDPLRILVGLLVAIVVVVLVVWLVRVLDDPGKADVIRLLL